MPTTSTTIVPLEDDCLESLIQFPALPRKYTVAADIEKDRESLLSGLLADWITNNEVEFIRGLCLRGDHWGLVGYARIVLNDARRWDDGVDVCRIKSCARLHLERAGYFTLRDPDSGSTEILATR